jgi:hypothetical protein
MNDDQPNINFTAKPSISGTVKDALGVPVSGVTITLSGSASGTTTTNGLGQYTLGNLTGGGNYTVTPSKGGLQFTPAAQSYTNMTEDNVQPAEQCEWRTSDEPDEQRELFIGRKHGVHVGCGGEYDGRRSDQFSVRCGESVKDSEQRDDGDERI